MPRIEKLTLDVLKAHEPNVVEFANRLGMLGPDYVVGIRVIEMDDKTESIEVSISGGDLAFDQIEAAIVDLGGALHSVDEVIVSSRKPRADELS